MGREQACSIVAVSARFEDTHGLLLRGTTPNHTSPHRIRKRMVEGRHETCMYHGQRHGEEGAPTIERPKNKSNHKEQIQKGPRGRTCLLVRVRAPGPLAGPLQPVRLPPSRHLHLHLLPLYRLYPVAAVAPNWRTSTPPRPRRLHHDPSGPAHHTAGRRKSAVPDKGKACARWGMLV